ncbi:lysoplasmalogenase [Nocardioides solisilvae]|uniref:lysoplasmalogenase n=1 Tax=Nocardioides solisilvae TaxID=1542435 RepID=UPI0013A5B665|nr:lysoplasmalogenase [Nocardioides solisilvae]
MLPSKTTLLSAAYVGLSAADSVVAGRGPGARRARLVLKPTLMPVLTAAFVSATRGPDRRAGTRLLRTGTVAAQALSWGGDVALLGSGKRPFLAGLGSFLGAHVAYLAAFGSVRGEHREHDVAGVEVALGAWLVLAPGMAAAAGRQDHALRGPVAAYATVITAMPAASRVLDPALPREARRRVRAGTALFLLSDTVLGLQRFALRDPHPVVGSVVMSTYTAGQGLIAAGVAGATRG